MPKIAMFDLDLTLTTRHLWKDLFYHRRESRELWKQPAEVWTRDLGGPAVFHAERLTELFEGLQAEGFVLAIATYNKQSVARAFLRAFGWDRFFADEMILSRDTAAGSKADYLETFAENEGLNSPADFETGLYFDDTLEECEHVKTTIPNFRVYHVTTPLSSPDARFQEIV